MKIPTHNILSKTLSQWYKKNQRPLPWRMNKNPYRIWISEVMLQQTTAAAVVPYYERFLNQFPTLQDLASANESDVLKMWSGLGYYHRARNLLRSAQVLSQRAFPKSHIALLELPGFGPYISRAVSSLAFSEPVGVVDGNVIRVLSRLYANKSAWWKSKEKVWFQKNSDLLAQAGDPYIINQALMDLGAEVCTPQKPNCILCPWQKFCLSHQNHLTSHLPIKKTKPAPELWLWEPQIFQRKNKVALVKNSHLPFLRGSFIFPGKAKKIKRKPGQFDLLHNITRYKIYVKIKKGPAIKTPLVNWTLWDDFSGKNPSSLMQKIMMQQKKLGND